IAKLAVAQARDRVVLVQPLQRLGGRLDVPFDQRRADRLGDLEREDGLAGAGLALDQERALNRDRGVHRDLEVVGCYIASCAADDRKQLAFEVVDRNAQAMTDISDSIYYFGELGMQEFETAKLLKDTLTAAGFRVEVGGAGMPTNVWAEWGSGRPKIAIVTEID